MFRDVQCFRKMGASFIHVQWLRCQEFCHASRCSVNLVPLKHSVSISFVKHYSQATGVRREEGMGKKEGKLEIKMLHKFLLSFHHSTNMASSSFTNKSARREQHYQDRLRMKVIRDGKVGGESRGPVCRAERCAAHHLQTGRQFCLGSLFLPQYERSLDRLQQASSTVLWGL